MTAAWKERIVKFRGIRVYLVLLLIVVAMFITIFSLMNYSSFDPQIDRYRKALQAGEYLEAGRYFAEDIRGEPELERMAQALVVQEIEVLKEAYVEQEIDGAEISANLAKMRESTLLADSIVIDLAEQDMEVLTLSLEAFGEAAVAERRGDLGEAIRLYSQVQLLDPNYEETQIRLVELHGRYIRQEEAEVESMIAGGDYARALTRIGECENLLPGEPTWSELRTKVLLKQSEASRNSVLDQSQADIVNGEYAKALSRLEQATAVYPDDPGYLTAYSQTRALIEQRFIEQADQAWAVGNQSGARSAIDAGLELLPDSPALRTWQILYQTLELPAYSDAVPSNAGGQEAN